MANDFNQNRFKSIFLSLLQQIRDSDQLIHQDDKYLDGQLTDLNMLVGAINTYLGGADQSQKLINEIVCEALKAYTQVLRMPSNDVLDKVSTYQLL